MAEIATIIISLVSWGSRLALDLYKLGGAVSSATRDINRIAKTVTLLSLTLKQVGATVKEDDIVPSPEAIDTVQDILGQCRTIFSEIQALVPINELSDNQELNDDENESKPLVQIQKWKWSLRSKARMDYLLGHLESLKLTLSVMLQTFYMVRIIMWSRKHHTISPERVADSVQNERVQMEILIIEQQMSLISASKLFDELRRSEAFSLPPLLTEGDSSKSIMPIEDQTKQIAKVENLSQYQEPSLAKLDVLTPDTKCLIMVHRVSAAYIKEVLKKWTRLREIEERLDHTEHEIDAQRKQDQSERRKSQQPTVESDDSDDQLGALPGIKQSNPRFAAPTPRRAPSAGPLFPDSPTMPIPVPKTTFGPTAPLSPASSSQYGVSPRSSGVFSSSPQQSPRSSLSSLPTRAAAAVKMHNEDESVDLEIPWRLCLRTQYWEYIDGKVERTNSEYPSSKALTDRNTSTEIMASWVCREAIEEVGYKYETLKKERNDGRRTKLETCFSISRPLTFPEVERLVERTVEIYRQSQRQSQRSPSPKRRYSNDRTPTYNSSPQHPHHDRAPSYAPHPPPLERATTSFPFPPPQPPLTRATTFPGPDPAFPHSPTSTANAYTAYPPTPQTPSLPPSPTQQRSSQQRRRSSASSLHARPPSPTPSSDEDAATYPRRRESGGSGGRRRPSSSHSHKEKSGRRGSSTVGTLAKVGGLAVLLDGMF